MNDRDQTLLDDYFDGRLNEEQAEALRRRAAVESEFGQEFALRELMHRWMKHGPQQKAIPEVTPAEEPAFYMDQTVEKPEPVRRNKRQVWPFLAACFLLLILLTVYLFIFGRPD